MKQNIILLISLAVLSVVSGMLMSDASWIGRVGITLFHKEYALLKIWWQGALAVYLMLVLVFAVHAYTFRKMARGASRTLHILLLLAAAGGLYLTYNDFHTDFTHKLLKWRFHYGFYLVWVGWIVTSLVFITKKKTVTGTGNTAEVAG